MSGAIPLLQETNNELLTGQLLRGLPGVILRYWLVALGKIRADDMVSHFACRPALHGSAHTSLAAVDLRLL